MYTLICFAIHSLICSLIYMHSHWLTWPLLVALNSAPWQLGGYHPIPMGFLLLLATLSSATAVSQRAPAFIKVSSCTTAPLPFREHPCHSGWLCHYALTAARLALTCHHLQLFNTYKKKKTPLHMNDTHEWHIHKGRHLSASPSNWPNKLCLALW